MILPSHSRQPNIYLDCFFCTLSFCQLLIIWTKIPLIQIGCKKKKPNQKNHPNSPPPSKPQNFGKVEPFLEGKKKEIFEIILLDLLNQDLLEVIC